MRGPRGKRRWWGVGGETTGSWEQAGQPWTSGLKAWILLEACWVSGVEGPVVLSKNPLSCGPVTCGQLGSLFSHVHGYPQNHTLGERYQEPRRNPPLSRTHTDHHHHQGGSSGSQTVSVLPVSARLKLESNSFSPRSPIPGSTQGPLRVVSTEHIIHFF